MDVLTIKQAEDRIYTVYAWLTQVSHGHGYTITTHSNISINLPSANASHLLHRTSQETVNIKAEERKKGYRNAGRRVPTGKSNLIQRNRAPTLPIILWMAKSRI